MANLLPFTDTAFKYRERLRLLATSEENSLLLAQQKSATHPPSKDHTCCARKDGVLANDPWVDSLVEVGLDLKLHG